MNTLKQRLLTNWNFARFLRLGIGLWMLVWGIQTKDFTIGAIGGLFLFMAFSNTGCCGANSCTVPNRNLNNNK